MIDADVRLPETQNEIPACSGQRNLQILRRNWRSPLSLAARLHRSLMESTRLNMPSHRPQSCSALSPTARLSKRKSRHAVTRIARLSSDLRGVSSTADATAAAFEEARDEITRLNSDLGRVSSTADATAAALEEARDEITRLNSDLRRVSSTADATAAALEEARDEITRLNSDLRRVSSTADATAAALEEARSVKHALECAVAERDRQVDLLRATCDETHKLAALLRQCAEDERRLRAETVCDLARQVQLERMKQELGHARIDLELRRLGVADAAWTSAVDSVGSAKD